MNQSDVTWRRDDGWRAIRRSDPIFGEPADTSRGVAEIRCRADRALGRQPARQSTSWIQLQLHRLRLRDRDASSLQLAVGVLRLIAGHTGRGWRLLERQRLQRSV